MTDRYGVARALIAAHVLMMVAGVSLAMANTYTQCLVAMFIMGIGYSLTNPSTARGVLDWFPRDKRGTAMGLKQVGVPLGGIVAAGNGALAAHVDWQSIMWVVAVCIALNGIFCFGLLRYHRPIPAHERRSVFANMAEVLRDWNFNVYAILNGLINVGQTNFFGFLTLFLTSAAKASQELAGIAIGLAQTTSAIARIGWGWVSDRYYLGRRSRLVGWICLAAAVFLAMMALVGPGYGLVLGFFLTMVLGITIASFAPTMQAVVVEAVEPRLAGSAMGVNMVGVHIGGMLGPVMFGYMVDHGGGFASAWLVTAGTVLAGTLLLFFVFKERSKG